MFELEKAAGVSLFVPGESEGQKGRVDFKKYYDGQQALAQENPEYKALLDEHVALRNKRWAKKNAMEAHARELRIDFCSVLRIPSLTDAQKRVLQVAHELLWQCKPSALKRAEKAVKKAAAAETMATGHQSTGNPAKDPGADRSRSTPGFFVLEQSKETA
jgi:hypothetical protein